MFFAKKGYYLGLKFLCTLPRTVHLGIQNLRCPWSIFDMTGRYIRSPCKDVIIVVIMVCSKILQVQQMQLALLLFILLRIVWIIEVLCSQLDNTIA
jgi:hypothetical protein